VALFHVAPELAVVDAGENGKDKLSTTAEVSPQGKTSRSVVTATKMEKIAKLCEQG
jgi:hypothetical protein